MDFLEKLDMLIKKNGLNKRSFSDACGIPYTTIINWYNRGYNGLQLATVKKISDFFGTNLDFWAKENIVDPDYGKTAGFDVTAPEMHLIEKYRDLDDRGRKIVDMVLDVEYEESIKSKDDMLYTPIAAWHDGPVKQSQVDFSKFMTDAFEDTAPPKDDNEE